MTYALTRAEWRPTAPLAATMQLPTRGVFVHHSTTSAAEPAFAAARTIERIGIQRFGRLSYSALGHRDALIEGAADSIGAHTGGFATDGAQWNRVAYGYCFVGNYENDQLTDKQLSDFARWCRWAVDTGRLVPGFFLRPHQDVKATACPGRNILRRWPDLIEAAHQEDDMAAPTIVGHDSMGQWYRVDLNVATPISADAAARLRYLGVRELPTHLVDAELHPEHGSWRIVPRKGAA